MDNYSWGQLAAEVKKQPDLVPAIVSFLTYLHNPSCRRWISGKSAPEFAQMITFVLENSVLPKAMANFIAQRVYYYLEQDQGDILKQYTRKMARAANPHEALEYLKMLMDSAQVTSKIARSQVTEKPASRGITQQFMEKMETWLSSSPIGQKKRQQTVLSIRSPLEKKELEELRVETLVNFHKRQLIKWSLPVDARLNHRHRARELLRYLKSLEASEKNRHYRKQVREVKNALLVRSKLLTQPEIIINVINQGKRSFHHTLNRLAKLTTNRKLNQQIWYYLHSLCQAEIVSHSELFRHKLLACENVNQLDALLEQYYFADRTVFRQFPDLKRIQAVQRVRSGIVETPHRLEALLSKHLGQHGEVTIKNKLYQILAQNQLDSQVLHLINREKKLKKVLAKLSQVGPREEVFPVIQKLLSLLNRMNDPQNRISFGQFKASLNFVSDAVARHLIRVTRDNLARALQQQVKEVYQEQQLSARHRLSKLQEILQNPSYQEESITIFHESPLYLSRTIGNIRATDKQLQQIIDHTFAQTSVPAWLRRLIREAKLEEAKASQKTAENCLRDLQRTKQRWYNKEISSLKGELIALFKSYGLVNLASDNTAVVWNGYDVARELQDFYNTPDRVQINLALELLSNIRRELKHLVDEERAKQLRKLS